MNCKQANGLIHVFLDEEISQADEKLLKEHLSHCMDCKERFHSMRQTIAFVQSASHIYAPKDFTERVMAALPRESVTVVFRERMKRHPFFVAASLFLLLMTGSLVSLWTEDQQFQLTAAQPNKLQIDESNKKVIVPKNSVVSGDIVVRNADVSIEGQVEGNVTVIDGHIYLASTGHITGEKEEIHQAVEWVWFNLKKTAYQLVP